MKSKEFVGTCRKNKANNHKYVTVPRDNAIQPGEDVIVKPRKEASE